MTWEPTTNNPAGLYFAAGPVVVGTDTDDGNGESLQVTGPTALDSEAIVTDGTGNVTWTDNGSGIVLTMQDTTPTDQLQLSVESGVPQITLASQLDAGAGLAAITITLGQQMLIDPGTQSTGTDRPLIIGPNRATLQTVLGYNAPGGSSLRVRGLPTGVGTPPGGLSAGDIWVDTTAGAHQGVLKIY